MELGQFRWIEFLRRRRVLGRGRFIRELVRAGVIEDKENSLSRNSKTKRDRKLRKKKSNPPALLKVPFFANHDDNTHCFQASIRMILEYFTPGAEYTWELLDQLTGKKEGQWTWPLFAMIQLKNRGFDVVNIEDFDYNRFSNEGETYIKEKCGEEVGTAQIKHSDIPYEMKNAELFMKDFMFEPRVPDLQDIGKLLGDGYLIICNVNSCALNDLPGYSGHTVVIYKINRSHLFIHDPGLPPLQSRKIAHDKFVMSWAYPSEHEKNVMAFRYRG